MAGTTELPQPKYVDFREYILFQVQRTRTLVRQTDVLLLTTTAIAAVFFTLFLFTLLDHWAFTLGLPVWLRWTGFASVLGILGIATAIFLRTSAGRQVSSLFAARALEQAESKLENSLLTLVDLDHSDRASSAAIRSSLEKRAALALNDLDVDHAVDRRPLLHRIYALLLGVLLLFGYAFFAQKSVAESVYRIMLPWTQAAPPTQTKLLDIQPGNVTVSSGSHVEVSTFVDGKTPDKVWLVYSTADQRIVDERVELLPTEEGLGKFTGVIAGENGRGVDQRTTYHLVAGDGRSETFTIAVRPAPHAKISEIELTPPTYTGRPPRTQTIGAIDALEGTAVKLRGETNIPVETAWIQLFNSEAAEDRSGQLPLTISDGTQLSGNWTLKIRDDGTYPRFYRIECETEAGDREAAPPMHAIVIRPDARPEVQLLAPTSDLERPLNATVPLLIEAFDPDFRLSGLSVQVERQGQLLSSELLDVSGQRKVRVKHPLELKRMPLMVGDVLNFWVEARDNREPQANRRMTSKLRIRITEPVSEEEAEAQRKQDEADQEPDSAENQPEPEPESADDSPSEEMTPPSEDAAGGDEGNESEQDGGEGEDSRQSGEQSKAGEKQGNGKKNSGENPEGEGDSSEESANQPGEGDSTSDGEPEFDPDGADDDRVLEKMIEKMQQDGQQPKDEENSGDQSKPDDSQEGEGDGNNTPETPAENNGNETMPSEAAEQKDPQEENAETQKGDQPESAPNPNGDNSDGDRTGDEPDGSGEQMQSDQNNGTEPQPSTDDKNSNETGEAGADSTAGEPAGGDETGESAGSQPGEMTEEPNEGSTKPGPGEKPSDDPSDMTSEPRPSDTDPGGEKTPGKELGKGEATPGEGNETGPTERDPNQDPNAPDAQNPLDRPDDAMQENGSGKPDSSSQQTDQPPQPAGKSSDPQAKPDGQSPAGEDSAKPSGKQQDSAKPGDPAGKQPTKPGQQMKPDNQKPGETPSGPSPDTKTNPEQPNSPMSDQPGQEGAPESPDSQSDKGDSPSQKGAGDSPSSEKGNSDSPGNSPGQGDSPGEGQSDSEGAPSDKPGKGNGKPGAGKGQADPNREGGGATGTQQGTPEGTGNARGGDGATEGTPNPGQSSGPGGQGKAKEPDYSMEDRRKAAELVLNQLEKDLQRGEVDPELLEELGWDKDNLKQFQRRMADYLRNQNGGEEQSLKQRQFDEMLRNMRLNGARKSREGQSGGFESPDEFAPNLTPAPPEYRELEEAYKRSLSGASGK